MSCQPLLLSPLFLVVLLQPGAEEKAKKDLQFIQGTWVLAALEINGKDVPLQQLEGTILIVKGDEYKTKVKDKELFGFRLKLDPKQDPPAVDMTSMKPGEESNVHKGIYRIEKDTFKICRGLNAEQARPNQFATWPDTNYFVATWKKQVKTN